MSNEEYAALGQRGAAYKALNNPTDLDPIILVPGLGGSGIEGKLSGAKEPHWYCSSNADWFRLWIALGSMVGGYIDCWYNNVQLHYDPVSNTYSNSQGVQTRVMDFGGIKGIDYLDTDLFGAGITATAYFAPLIKDLQAVGYKPGVNLRGGPFDWRKPGNPDGFFENMKSLVENTSAINNGKKVHLLGHSMGNVQLGLFLNSMPEAWKDQYIASYIAVAAPWSGAPKALRAIISGDNFGLGAGDWFSLVDPLRVATIARQAGGIVLLTPEADFWNTTELVKTPTRTYDVDELSQLFVDIGSPVTAAILKQTDGVLSTIKAPGVPMHCLYGVDYPTEMHFTYNNGFNNKPEIQYSEAGDGTVPDISLRRCLDFQHQQPEPVSVKEFDLADHMTVLNDEELLQYVLSIISR
eukprot:TRINITY_DN987_c0_g3_i3.p2 TRINITY_DN987_c0_g3~~TRINITY_DN987_c0_g3_i3.p2  ORF type:complete len:409 (+),score=122.42 TRINITY_DN987_c0_g3_i3:188-1414(+)